MTFTSYCIILGLILCQVTVQIMAGCQTDKQAYVQETLRQHNLLRARHQAPPLVIDEELNAAAQEWADHLAETNSFEHSRGQYGENLYRSSRATGREKGDNWVRGMYTNEKPKWRYGSERSISGAGHFTQIVWKNSKRLGVAFATGAGCRGFWVVLKYDPAGNYRGQYTENVLPEREGGAPEPEGEKCNGGVVPTTTGTPDPVPEPEPTVECEDTRSRRTCRKNRRRCRRNSSVRRQCRKTCGLCSDSSHKKRFFDGPADPIRKDDEEPIEI